MSDEQGGNATSSPESSVEPVAPAGDDQQSTPPVNQVDGWPAPRLVDHEYKDRDPLGFTRRER